MCVNISHLVLVAFRDADDEIADDSLDRAESSDILARAMVYFD